MVWCVSEGRRGGEGRGELFGRQCMMYLYNLFLSPSFSLLLRSSPMISFPITTMKMATPEPSGVGVENPLTATGKEHTAAADAT